MSDDTARTLDELVKNSFVADDEDTKSIFDKLKSRGNDNFCLKALPKTKAFDEKVPESIHFIQLNSTDIGALSVHSSTSVDRPLDTVTGIMKSWPTNLNFFQSDMITTAPGHIRSDKKTRLDMNLGLKSGFCIIIFWNVLPLVRFGSDRYDPKDYPDDLTGQWAHLSLTLKTDTKDCALKRPRYLDRIGQGIITVCQFEKGLNLDFNLMLDVTDRIAGQYQTPVIIDPRVKNDG